MTTLIETTVETVKDRSADIVEALQEGIGTLGASAADRWAPDTRKSGKSWLWILLLAAGVVVVLAVLRQRSASAGESSEGAREG